MPVLMYGSETMIWKEGLECEFHGDGIRLEHVSEFRYSGCVLDESETDGAERNRKVVSERRVASAIRSLVNARNLQLESARVLHETLFLPVLTYDRDNAMEREGYI